MGQDPLLVMVLLRHPHRSSTTYASARRGLLARQKATVDGRGREAVDSCLQKLDTFSVCKVSYILMAVHILTNI